MPVRAPADYMPRGDMGLGLCYQGVHLLAQRALAHRMATPEQRASVPPGFVPNFAVTMAPYPVPELGGAVLALPCCFGCLSGSAAACGGPPERQAAAPLLVATGRVPR